MHHRAWCQEKPALVHILVLSKCAQDQQREHKLCITESSSQVGQARNRQCLTKDRVFAYLHRNKQKEAAKVGR